MSSVLKGIACKYVHINICWHCGSVLHWMLMESTYSQLFYQWVCWAVRSSYSLITVLNTSSSPWWYRFLSVCFHSLCISLLSLSHICFCMWARQKMNPDQNLMTALRNESVWDRLGLLRRTELICCTRMRICFIPGEPHTGENCSKSASGPILL